MANKILARQGTSFLIGIGPGEFQGHVEEMGRVFDRPSQTLHDPLPVGSITARGYWDPVDLPRAVSTEILDEVTAAA